MRELQLPGNQNIGAGLVNSGRNRLIPGGVVNLCVGAGDKEAQARAVTAPAFRVREVREGRCMEFSAMVINAYLKLLGIATNDNGGGEYP